MAYNLKKQHKGFQILVSQIGANRYVQFSFMGNSLKSFNRAPFQGKLRDLYATYENAINQYWHDDFILDDPKKWSHEAIQKARQICAIIETNFSDDYFGLRNYVISNELISNKLTNQGINNDTTTK